MSKMDNLGWEMDEVDGEMAEKSKGSYNNGVIYSGR